jgi:hypothetical protein
MAGSMAKTRSFVNCLNATSLEIVKVVVHFFDPIG